MINASGTAGKSSYPGPVIYETERLIVREWSDDPADTARIFDIYRHWEVARWIGMDEPLREPEQARTVITRWLARYEKNEHKYGPWAMQVKQTGAVAGTLLLGPLPEPSDGSAGRGEVEVGWHLHPDAWGHGYATEAARVAVGRAFSAGVPGIFAVVRPGNEPSMAVCRRLGMRSIVLTSRWYDTELEGFYRPR